MLCGACTNIELLSRGQEIEQIITRSENKVQFQRDLLSVDQERMRHTGMCCERADAIMIENRTKAQPSTDLSHSAQRFSIILKNALTTAFEALPYKRGAYTSSRHRWSFHFLCSLHQQMQLLKTEE
jgi:hypothetical protein